MFNYYAGGSRTPYLGFAREPEHTLRAILDKLTELAALAHRFPDVHGPLRDKILAECEGSGRGWYSARGLIADEVKRALNG
jgi:hypothetical protein